MTYIGAGISRFNTADELTVTGDAQIDTTTLVVDSTNNRVGVGTAAPSSIFHTEENTTGASIVRHKNTSNTSSAHSRLIIQNGGTSGGDALINLDTQASGSRFTLGVDRSASKFVIANADKGSFDGSNEAFVITSGGNVGIGTTSPDRSLHITSTEPSVVLENSGQGTDLKTWRMYSNSSSLQIGTVDDAFAAGQNALEITRDNTDSITSIQFKTGASSERMRIDSSGNVGIGESNPSLGSSANGLHITGASGNDGVLKLDSSDATHSGKIQFTENGTDQWRIAYDPTNNHLEFTESGVADRMVIADGGNVGIGTDSPDTTMHIHTGSAGTVDAVSGGVLTLEKNNHAVLQFLTPNDKKGIVYFGDPDDIDAGRLEYDHSSDAMLFNVNASERMRIASNGTLMVGTTDNFPGDGDTNTGIALAASGSAAFSRDGFRVVSVNRNTSDGTLVEFNKDGSEIGSIGAKGGDLIIGTGDVGIRFNDANDALRPTDQSTGSGRDNAIDIGDSGNRFKDLYLSGGAYLGGTGSANYLDDYEEGNWTPSSTGTATYIEQFGRYRKVGDVVYIMFILEINNIGTGEQERISGLPFAAARECTIHPSKLENINLSIVDATLRTSGTFLYMTHRTAAAASSISNGNYLKNNARVQASGWYHTSD